MSDVAPTPTPIPLVVFGGGGLLAGELLRLVEGHPHLHVVAVSSRSERSLAEGQPHLVATDAPTVSPESAEEQVVALAAVGPVAVAFALPHGESAPVWGRLRGRLGADAPRVTVVDLAADYRLRDPAEHQRVYGSVHADPEGLDTFVYGLPERNRNALRESRCAAAAGCFATALQLATLPAAEAGWLDAERPWIFSGVTGSSGSGSTPSPVTHHPHRHGNLRAYGLTGHRHEAELLQSLRELRIGGDVAHEDGTPALCFLPHSGPFARGIHLSAFLPLATPVSPDAACTRYRDAYADEPFVEVIEDGAPDLRRVVGSNRAAVAVVPRGDVLTVLLTLDNMIKGGAGQALQCLNLMLGLDETLGLPRSGMGIC